MTRPEPIAPSTVGDVNPSAPACMKPSMRVATARNRSTAPTMSSFGASAGISRLGRSRRRSWTSAMTAVSIPGTKTQAQPAPCTRRPAMIGPRAVMPMVMANALPVAAPRWAGGNTSTRSAVPAGTNSAAPTPAMNRATNSSVDEPMRPDATARPAATRKMSRPALNMGTRPFRSPSHPPRVTSPASERNARFMTHWLAVIEIPRSAWIDGRATVTPAVSRAQADSAAAAAIRAMRCSRVWPGASWAGTGWAGAAVMRRSPCRGLPCGREGPVQVPSRISARGR